MSITEALVEQVALDLLQELGWRYKDPADIAPDGPHKRRTSNGEVILSGLLEEAARRINPHIPQEVRRAALKQVQGAETPSLIAQIRAPLLPKLTSGEIYLKDAEAVNVEERRLI